MLDSTSGSWRLNYIRDAKPFFLWAFTFQEETRPIDEFLLYNVSEVWDQVQVGEWYLLSLESFSAGLKLHQWA